MTLLIIRRCRAVGHFGIDKHFIILITTDSQVVIQIGCGKDWFGSRIGRNGGLQDYWRDVDWIVSIHHPMPVEVREYCSL